MIFVTVGTHEQPMDRLFEALENGIANGTIRDSVFVQSGATRRSFLHCEYADYLSASEMQNKMNQSRVVVCHGGPATILQARAAGKVPVVVPRQHRFGEHVNDHQVEFCRRLEREGSILMVTEIDKLAAVIEEAPTLKLKGGTSALPGRSELCRRLTDYCREIQK